MNKLSMLRGDVVYIQHRTTHLEIYLFNKLTKEFLRANFDHDANFSHASKFNYISIGIDKLTVPSDLFTCDKLNFFRAPPVVKENHCVGGAATYGDIAKRFTIVGDDLSYDDAQVMRASYFDNKLSIIPSLASYDIIRHIEDNSYIYAVASKDRALIHKDYYYIKCDIESGIIEKLDLLSSDLGDLTLSTINFGAGKDYIFIGGKVQTKSVGYTSVLRSYLDVRLL